MPNYSNSKVYKLINSVDKKIYIGSTTQPLSTRLAEHKSKAKSRPYSVYKHLNTIGWDKVRIILIETVNCFNKEQLNQREQHYIDLYQPSLNKNSAYANNQVVIKEVIKEVVPINCEHNIKKYFCKICYGSIICEHKKKRYVCKICHGSGICEHNREKSRCRDCGGGNICEHNMRKARCKVCVAKYCECCDIIIRKGNYKKHINSIIHIYNFIHC